MTPLEALKRYFGYDSFRPGQAEIVDAILARRDALAIMPTGAGKSICYQVPALLLPGITLVISPLISLMQDQVKALNAAGIRAAYINSSLSESQISRALNLAAEGSYKIIYVAPERLESGAFRSFAAAADISMVTVDEAHCISQWGQDFRPSYLKILDFVDSLPERPILSAFTATATREVRDDIICTLRLHDPELLVTGFDRPNLYFQVEQTHRKDDFVLQYLRDHPGESGIIYCATRKNVDKLQALLADYGFAATKYHAGLAAETRKKNQNDFIYDKAPVIVATNAFGMGIDKSNVRFVLHYNMPQSMENYYQDAGRAGRDGLPSQCVLLFSAQDVVINKFLLDRKDFSESDDEDAELLRQRDLQRLQTMERYCKTTACLRNYILEYFGEHPAAPCGNCGSCNNVYEQADLTAAAKWMINCVAETRGRFGKAIVFGTLQGANRARLKEIGATNYKSYGQLKDLPRDTLDRLLAQLLEDGYLVQTDDQYAVLRMGDITPLKQPGAQVLVKLPPQQEPERVQRPKKRSVMDALTKAGLELYQQLRTLRFEIAQREGLPPYVVFGDKSLADMCLRAPATVEGMIGIYGMGERKYEKYADQFFAVIDAYRADHRRGAELGCPRSGARTENARKNRQARQQGHQGRILSDRGTRRGVCLPGCPLPCRNEGGAGRRCRARHESPHHQGYGGLAAGRAVDCHGKTPHQGLLLRAHPRRCRCRPAQRGPRQRPRHALLGFAVHTPGAETNRGTLHQKISCTSRKLRKRHTPTQNRCVPFGVLCHYFHSRNRMSSSTASPAR